MLPTTSDSGFDLLGQNTRWQRFDENALVLRVLLPKSRQQLIHHHKLITAHKQHQLRVVDVAVQIRHIVDAGHGKTRSTLRGRIPGRVILVRGAVDESVPIPDSQQQ